MTRYSKKSVTGFITHYGFRLLVFKCSWCFYDTPKATQILNLEIVIAMEKIALLIIVLSWQAIFMTNIPFCNNVLLAVFPRPVLSLSLSDGTSTRHD